jgi:hypothetical protein|tara:strand:+ start:595 stop:831 length:237 start_codon:yes stop_codon:yes gene_type:complete
MRVRDLQQYLGKFTNEMKGSNLSDAHIYIETQSGHLEEIKRIEVQESKLINAQEPVRVVLKHENVKRWTTNTPKKVHI